MIENSYQNFKKLEIRFTRAKNNTFCNFYITPLNKHNTRHCTDRQINGNNLKFWESTNQLLTAAVKPSPPFPPDETCLYPRIHEFFVEPLQRLVVPMHPPATKADDTDTKGDSHFHQITFLLNINHPLAAKSSKSCRTC